MYKMKKYHLFKCNEHCKRLNVIDMEQYFNSMSELFEHLVVYCNQIDDFVPYYTLSVAFNKSFFSPLDFVPYYTLSVAFNKSFFSPLNRDIIYQSYKSNFNYLTSLYSKFDVIPVCSCTYFFTHSPDCIYRLVFLVKISED